MLPRFPDLTEEFGRYIAHFMEQRMQAHLGPFAEIPRVTIFEGDGTTVMIGPDGLQQESTIAPHSERLEIPTQEFKSLDMGALQRRLDELTGRMAAEMQRRTYATFAASAERSDQIVMLKGKEFSEEDFFRLFESFPIDFNPDGKAVMPQVHLSPALTASVVQTLRKMDEDPSCRQRFEALMETKKEEWRAREASRMLVG